MITHGASAETAALVEQGMAAMKAGNREAALAVFRFATEIDPSNETAWLWLASIYTELPVVAHCLQRVVTLNPQNEQAKQALQAVLVKMQPAQSAASPSTTNQTQPTGDSGDQLGVYGQQANEPRPGYDIDSTRISGWLARQSAGDLDFDEVKRRGIVAAKGGRYDEAMEYLMMAVEKNDSDPESWYWLSTIIEDPEEKQIALENVLTLEPEHPAALAAVQANATMLEEKRAEKLAGRRQEALKEAREQQAAPVVAAQPSKTGGSSKLLNQIMGTGGAASIPSPGQVVGGRYTAMRMMRGTTDIAAWDASKRRFFILRPHVGDAAELGGNNSTGVVTFGNTRYSVLPIETKGLSLSSFVRTVGALPPALVVDYGITMLKTLEAEQSSNPGGNAQKSLRPDTITLDAASNISLEPPADDHATSSLSNHAVPYIPPEQLEKGLVSPNSDIYSIGAILYFMLTGTPPTLDRLPVKQAEQFVPNDFSAFGDAPGDLARVIATALQANPLERYGSARAMHDALKSTEAGRGGSLPFRPRQMLITVGVVGVAILTIFMLGGKLKDLRLPSFGTNQGQGLAATPVPAPALLPTQPPAPLPVTTLRLNAVDSRRFPQDIAYFSALDAAGVPVPGINGGMVTVKENGQAVGPVQVTQLSRTTDPVSVIVLLDTSDGMAGRAMDDAKTAIHYLADGLQPGDQMALITFGGSAQLAVAYTVSKSSFLVGVDSQEAGDKRAIEGAFRQVADIVRLQPQGGYTAVVLVTNGGLPSKAQDMVQLTSPANEANAPVFFLGLDPATYPASAEQLASATGGMAFKAAKAEAGPAAEAMKLIEKQIHNVYKLTFDSHAPGVGAQHNLELTLNLGPTTLLDKHSYQVSR
jgi:Mg-chelatase subunit ChlD/tetratricopeptide (TPR) repeat protein